MSLKKVTIKEKYEYESAVLRKLLQTTKSYAKISTKTILQHTTNLKSLE